MRKQLIINISYYKAWRKNAEYKNLIKKISTIYNYVSDAFHSLIICEQVWQTIFESYSK